MKLTNLLLAACLVLAAAPSSAQSDFVQRKGHQFLLRGKPYYYVGTNYWYGSLLPLQANRARGIDRLRRELDFLKAHGVRNLRVLAGAEGSGTIQGVPRVGPPLQPQKGRFDPTVLDGLDVLLAEMGKRDMKAIVFFSNNWEWSGGFLQYLRWNGVISDSDFRRKLSWDELRDAVSRFYACAPCRDDYRRQVDYVLARTNTVTGRRYTDDPVIMAWELANEPRPMRPAASEAYRAWISATAAHIKSKDRRHLVTLGHEGSIGTESMELFEAVHQDPNVDYSTIHIWPKNWGWLRADHIEEDYPVAAQKTADYIGDHVRAAQRMNKPVVIEEFGLVRDSFSFSPSSATVARDRYYDLVFGHWKRSADTGGVIAGANFWAFNGEARPRPGQAFWKPGDDYMGDPPMEEQSLYGVFDSDRSTWYLLDRYARAQRGVVPVHPKKAKKGGRKPASNNVP
ncbi:glycoside hydrolase 5 family protein [Flaviaesturariibacter amylovorans]|uniref:mannan endo-1,4-beta-mannosidase n=1 Tax=Flaviaesturariibacter amylovorans TaxID=1084520 RepID=A0ABP8GJN3_9BACT